ncbi:Flp family type IVb pilin [Roseibium aestuarii]|uniref:Flp family type IVb pilin n=1 Tax=Roseibium aestuarii TaxID=2600299 RepID=A0ABW4JUA7_9HYPH|nr:Flp family type IVb pilin [Roseibium aestuarii]
MTNLLARFAKDESGATAIEYGLIAGLLAVAIITVLGTMGGNLNSIFGKIDAGLSSAAQ